MALLWQELAGKAQELAHSGITAIWLPPSYKGTGGKWDVGYGVYDLFDLGEFNQKDSVATKYGTKEQLLAAIEALHSTKYSGLRRCSFQPKRWWR